jgi:hypothetical protein
MTEPQPAVGYTYAELRALYSEISSRGALCPLADSMSGARASSRPAVVLRHDVDLSLGPARDLAGHERSWGFRATYFFRADERAYSLRSPANVSTIRGIAQWHEIGLHAVIAGAPESDADPAGLVAALQTQKACLEEAVGISIAGFSFHKPAPGLLWGDPLVAGLYNAYAWTFRDRYVSDSGGRFSRSVARRAVDLASSRGGQLLLHPVWWGWPASSPRERLAMLLSGTDEDQRRSLATEVARTVGWWSTDEAGGRPPGRLRRERRRTTADPR